MNPFSVPVPSCSITFARTAESALCLVRLPISSLSKRHIMDTAPSLASPLRNASVSAAADAMLSIPCPIISRPPLPASSALLYTYRLRSYDRMSSVLQPASSPIISARLLLPVSPVTGSISFWTSIALFSISLSIWGASDGIRHTGLLISIIFITGLNGSSPLSHTAPAIPSGLSNHVLLSMPP